jgi:mercuric ion transport protein
VNTTSTQSPKKRFFAALAGTALVALCCLAPILVVLFGVVGFSAFTLYLDLVLLPSLAIMIALSIVSYLRWLKQAKNQS